MGAWGEKPFENDTAADWFGTVFANNPLIDDVDKALESGSSEEQYAALWVVAKLARVYVWPIERYDRTLELALAAVNGLLEGTDPDDFLELWENDPDVIAQLAKLKDSIAKRA